MFHLCARLDGVTVGDVVQRFSVWTVTAKIAQQRQLYNRAQQMACMRIVLLLCARTLVSVQDLPQGNAAAN